MKPKPKPKGVMVAAPEIRVEDAENAGAVLLNFYQALGWNKLDRLDPCKVRTTAQIYDQLHQVMLQKFPNAFAVGTTMVNCAPGVDSDIPPRQVFLIEGWTEPEVETESGE